jgi:hypothetical protein
MKSKSVLNKLIWCHFACIVLAVGYPTRHIYLFDQVSARCEPQSYYFQSKLINNNPLKVIGEAEDYLLRVEICCAFRSIRRNWKDYAVRSGI